MKREYSLLFFVFIYCSLFSQNIRLNQIGFHPNSYKVAVVPNSVSGEFTVQNSSGTAIYTGSLGEEMYWGPASAYTKIADFSDFSEPGTYTVRAGGESSYEFEISEDIYTEPAKGLTRAFYYWRSSTALESQHATHSGVNFSRALGHPDNAVVVDGSAASSGRPAGTEFDCSKGWYDAGDYGKYMVSAGVSAYYLMNACEIAPEFAANLNLNIPESNDNIPDVLNEAKWETDWILKMQDPSDGGVYFQVTTQGFADWIQPAQDQATRYAYKKTTASTLDFAASMAVAYRIFSKYESEFPGYAQECLDAAEYAWQWALDNPNIEYLKAGGTGDYEEFNQIPEGERFNDEFAWAANELFISTGNAEYYNAVDFLNDDYVHLEEPSWQKASGLGLFSLMLNLDKLPEPADKEAIEHKFMSFTDSLWDIWNESGYKVMTNRYWWGINAIVGTQGAFFLIAYNHTKDRKYLNAAVSHLDYIYGRNPTGYSYVTWYGDKTPMHPHDRRAASDGINEPLPGYIVGGAFDNCITCEGTATQYEDSEANYEKNEIAINFNSPSVFLIYGLAEAMEFKGASYTSSTTGSENNKTITISVSTPLKEETVSDISAFSVTADGNPIAIESVSVANSTIVVTLSDALTPFMNEILVSYTGTEIQSLDGEPLTIFEDKEVKNELPGGNLVLNTIAINESGTAITMEFDKTIGQTPKDYNEFSIQVNGFAYAISTIDIAGKLITLHLLKGIKAGDEIMFSYSGNGIIAEDTGIFPAYGPVALSNPLKNQNGTADGGLWDEMNNNDFSPVWSAKVPMELEENSDTLIVHCNNKDGYSHLKGHFTNIDISNNPTVEIRLQADNSFTMRVDIGSFDESSNETIFTNADPLHISIEGSPDFQTITLEFTNFSGSYPAGTVDPTELTNINIMFNPNEGYDGDVLIDYIHIGDEPSPENESHLLAFEIDDPYLFTEEFSSGTYMYYTEIAKGASPIPQITATPISENAVLEYHQATSTKDTAYVIVTSADNASSRKYSVVFKELNIETEYKITLDSGLNFIAFEVLPEDKSFSNILGTAVSSIASIKTFDEYYNADQPEFTKTLYDFAYGEGYLVNCSAKDTIEVTGYYADIQTLQLKAGWNIIGVSALESMSVENALQSIWDSFEELKDFENSYVKDRETNGIEMLERGKAYFIKVNADCEIQL